jgi:hypothetical protein
MAKDSIEKKLKSLRDLVRREEEGKPVASYNLPEDLAREGARSLGFTSAEWQAIRRLEEELSADPRFEHLEGKERKLLLRFVARVLLETDRDQVEAFLVDNAKEPEEQQCYFPVEFLQLKEGVDVAGVSLLPMIQSEREERDIALAPDVGTVVAVPVVGTHQKRMAERARAHAEHALRILRLTLREERNIHPYQLRFRLGDHFSFESGMSGWDTPSDVGWDLEVDSSLLELAERQPLWTAPLTPHTRLDRRIDRAMRWVEQTFLVGDELLELLFCFFALEALLGNKSKGLKAQRLAFRRALLGSVAQGGFAHPNRVALLYDKVRSAAVHGGEPPKVPEKMLTAFVWDTRRALTEFVSYARENDLKSQGKLLVSLEESPKRDLLIKGLREKEPEEWEEFLDKLEKRS